MKYMICSEWKTCTCSTHTRHDEPHEETSDCSLACGRNVKPCIQTFERELDILFNEAVDVHDTVWFTESETLRDAIMRIHEETK